MADSPDAPRDTARLIAVLGLGCFASSLAGRVLDPLVGELSAEFAAAPATVALLGTAFALPYALVQPVLGPVGDGLGKRRVVLAGLVALALALTAGAMAPDLGWLFALRVLAGAASGAVFPLCIAIIGDRVPLAGRQLALSRLLVASLSGQVLGGAASGFLSPVLGWRGVLLLCAAIAALAALVLRLDRVTREAPPAARPGLGEALGRYRHLLGLPAARKLYAAVFIEAGLIFGLFPFFAPLLMARGLGGTEEAGLAVAAFGVGGFLFAALAPAMLRRLGQARMVRLGAGFCAAGLAVLAVAPHAAVFVPACTLLGLGFYMIHTSIQTRVTEVAPGARGSAVALHAFGFFLGQSLGPVLFGAGQATLGATLTLFACAAGLLALGAWLGRGR